MARGMVRLPQPGPSESVIASSLVSLPSCATLGTLVPSGKGPLSGLRRSAGSSGAGSPLLRPFPLLPFSNISCGFLT